MPRSAEGLRTVVIGTVVVATASCLGFAAAHWLARPEAAQTAIAAEPAVNDAALDDKPATAKAASLRTEPATAVAGPDDGTEAELPPPASTSTVGY